MLNPELLRETLEIANMNVGSVSGRRMRQGVRRLSSRDRLFIRETQAILSLLGVERSHQAIFQWVHRVSDSVSDPPSAKPSRLAIDETAVRINGEQSWLYAAIDIDTKLLLDVAVFGRRGTDPAAAFLHALAQKHDLSEAVFLVDGYGYLTSLFRLGLSVISTMVTETSSRSGFKPSKCASTASITPGWAVGQASASGLNSSYIIITISDRIKRSTIELPPRRF